MTITYYDHETDVEIEFDADEFAFIKESFDEDYLDEYVENEFYDEDVAEGMFSAKREEYCKLKTFEEKVNWILENSDFMDDHFDDMKDFHHEDAMEEIRLGIEEEKDLNREYFRNR